MALLWYCFVPIPLPPKSFFRNPTHTLLGVQLQYSMFKSKFIQHVSSFYARASVPLLPAPSASAVVWDTWTSNYPSWANKGLFCQANICVQKCTVWCCNCLKYHCGSDSELQHAGDSLSLSNYLCPAQTLPEAPLQLYCICVGQTLMLTNWMKKSIFCTYNSDCRTSIMPQL